MSLQKAQVSALESERNTLKTQMSLYRQVLTLRSPLLVALHQVSTTLVSDQPALAASIPTLISCLEQLQEQTMEPAARLLQVQVLKLQGELHTLTQEGLRLRKHSAALEAEVARLRKSEELHVQMEQELVKRARIWQKLVKSPETQAETTALPPLPPADSSQDRFTALERELQRLRKALSRKHSEARTADTIIALLAHYTLRRADTKESTDPAYLLHQDFRTLTLLQKQQLAEHILAQGHDLLRKSQALPPLVSPVRPDHSSRCDFDFQQVSIALKPKPRPQAKMGS